jgi:hypothetical protein
LFAYPSQFSLSFFTGAISENCFTLLFNFTYQTQTFQMGAVPQEHLKYDVPVAVVGGGPVGMLTAFELSRLGIDCILAEQSLETTKWPKMDLTNCRLMEIMRMLGIADEYRTQNGAVSGDSYCDSVFYTSCGPRGKVMATWVSIPVLNGSSH